MRRMFLFLTALALSLLPACGSPAGAPTPAVPTSPPGAASTALPAQVPATIPPTPVVPTSPPGAASTALPAQVPATTPPTPAGMVPPGPGDPRSPFNGGRGGLPPPHTPVPSPTPGSGPVAVTIYDATGAGGTVCPAGGGPADCRPADPSAPGPVLLAVGDTLSTLPDSTIAVRTTALQFWLVPNSQVQLRPGFGADAPPQVIVTRGEALFSKVTGELHVTAGQAQVTGSDVEFSVLLGEDGGVAIFNANQASVLLFVSGSKGAQLTVAPGQAGSVLPSGEPYGPRFASPLDETPWNIYARDSGLFRTSPGPTQPPPTRAPAVAHPGEVRVVVTTGGLPDPQPEFTVAVLPANDPNTLVAKDATDFLLPPGAYQVYITSSVIGTPDGKTFRRQNPPFDLQAGQIVTQTFALDVGALHLVLLDATGAPVQPQDMRISLYPASDPNNFLQSEEDHPGDFWLAPGSYAFTISYAGQRDRNDDPLKLSGGPFSIQAGQVLTQTVQVPPPTP